MKTNKGWIQIIVSGTSYDIGLLHGQQLRKHMAKIPSVLQHIVKTQLKISFKKYMADCARLIQPLITPPIKEELEGMVAGTHNPDITYELLVGWNAFLSMCTYYEQNHVRCCAFIATGSKTKDGKIVMGHNTHSDYKTGAMLSIVQDTRPTEGNRFIMQTAPGFVCSSADWFLCANGIIGCETTISNLNYKPDFQTGLRNDRDGHLPYFCRIRQAMQYGESIDDFIRIITHKSAGDYACTWFIGDTKTNEICMIDDVLGFSDYKRTKDGVFFASNEAGTAKALIHATTRDDHNNPASSTGARYMRMAHLLYGDKPLSVPFAKRILTDHYDNSTRRVRPSKFTICKHAKKSGATDAKVVDSAMASNMTFIGRMGPPCNKNSLSKSFPWTNVEPL